MFYGIIVYLYVRDNKQHHLLHIHVEYTEFSAAMSIEEGEVLSGNLPKKQLSLVQAWIGLHQDELLADWKLARQGETPYKIAPL